MFFGNNFFFGLTIITIFLPLLAYGHSSQEQGMANNNYVPEISARIVNGTQSVAGQFPYVVSLRIAEGYSNWFICGGIILNKLWILTTGHCLYWPLIGHLPKPGALKVIAGENSLVVWWKASYKRTVSKIVVHPEWQYDKREEIRWKRFPNDVALLKVHKALVFNDYVRPIKIISHSLPANTTCVIAGYGSNNYGPMFNLYYSTEYLYSNDFCKTNLPLNTYEYPDGTLCAGNIYKYSGPCLMDCAAPLVCDGGLAGMLLTYGSGCGALEKTAIYLDVKYHRNWIQKEIHIPTIKKNAVKTSKTHTLHDSSNSFFIVHSLLILYCIILQVYQP